MKTLRPYQQSAVDTIMSNLDNGIDKALLVLATGLGKTVTAVKTAERFKRTLFIIDSEELLEQGAMAFIREKFSPEQIDYIEKFGFLNCVKGKGLGIDNYNIGCIKADIFIPIGNVVFASIQTLYRRLDKLQPDMFDCVIVDEAHCYMAKQYFKGVSFFTPKLRLGLTATPTRLDNLPLDDLFDKIIYEYNIGDGIKDGYLVELDAIKIKTNVSLDKVRTLGGELNSQDLSNEIDTIARNNLICDSWLKYAKGRKTIAYCCNIQHALNLCEVFLSRDIKATCVSSNEELTGDRTGKIKGFRGDEYDVIFNVNILTKGVDIPKVSCIMNCAPTKSITRFMQGIGRGTRTLTGVIDGLETVVERWKAIKKSDKKECLIIDIVDNTTRHSIVNCWNLDLGLNPEDRVFITEEKRQKLIDARANKAVFLQHTREEDEKVSLFKIPRVKRNNSIRMSEDATPLQLETIKKLNYDIENVHFTKQMAHEIIGQLPLSHKKLDELKALKYDVSDRVVTYNDYNACIREMNDIKWKKEQKQKFKKQNKYGKGN